MNRLGVVQNKRVGIKIELRVGCLEVEFWNLI